MGWFEAMVPHAFVRGLKLCRVDKDLKRQLMMIGSKFITTNTIQLNKPKNHRASLDLICHGTKISAIFGPAFPPLPLAPLSHNRAFIILGSNGNSNRWGQQEQSYAEPFELFQVRKKKRTKCSNLSSGGDVTSSRLPPIPKRKPE